MITLSRRSQRLWLDTICCVRNALNWMSSLLQPSQPSSIEALTEGPVLPWEEMYHSVEEEKVLDSLISPRAMKVLDRAMVELEELKVENKQLHRDLAQLKLEASYLERSWASVNHQVNSLCNERSYIAHTLDLEHGLLLQPDGSIKVKSPPFTPTGFPDLDATIDLLDAIGKRFHSPKDGLGGYLGDGIPRQTQLRSGSLSMALKELRTLRAMGKSWTEAAPSRPGRYVWKETHSSTPHLLTVSGTPPCSVTAGSGFGASTLELVEFSTRKGLWLGPIIS